VHELLVRWDGQNAADAIWVELEAFKKEFPAFQLKGKLIVKEGRDAMVGLTYRRRKKASTDKAIPSLASD
jgi:hypothetical protein